MFQRTRGSIHRIAPATTFARCWTASDSTGLTWSAFRWAVSRPSTSASPTPSARSLVIAGCGYGAEPEKRQQFAREAELAAERFEELGAEEAGTSYALGPTRVQFQNSDLRGWAEFRDQLIQHSATGSANTLRGVQAARPSVYELVEEMRRITAPTLVLMGDEDWPCLEPGILMKREIATAALAVIPNAGHTINLKAPAEFNRVLGDFLHAAEVGRWPTRDPHAMAGAILGTTKSASGE